ncbi:MAG: two-component system, OmpR family, sensor kinase [Gaiellaceae bacterium]|nr:two-component system, OmpR family, sensor kinase [Gaiellaceae bacterium]
MFRSLRFRLPALFLVGIVLAAVIAGLIAVRFFQSYTHTRAVHELGAESAGIVQQYSQQAGIGNVPVQSLRKAIGGDEIFWVPAVRGASLFAGSVPVPPSSDLQFSDLVGTGVHTINMSTNGRGYLAVARIVRLAGLPAGAIVVAKPNSTVTSRWLQLLGELGIAFGIGIPLAVLLVIFFSRRVARPLEALTRAADEVAAGHYEIALPGPGGGSEIERLATRFGEMASRLAESEELSRHFLMSVSHELRTPLTAIRGHISALREGVIEDEVSRDRSLDVVAEEGARLERLVGDVLDLAKLDARRFAVLREEVDMRVLCERAHAAFAAEAQARGIELGLAIGGDAVLVTDGDRVLQIVSNLLANAIQWTPEGGSVELALAVRTSEVVVTVTDTGPGIPADEQERIFRPFWSGHGGHGGGTGLGLTIASELASALGGRLAVDSKPGSGSRFVLVLPRRAQPA